MQALPLFRRYSLYLRSNIQDNELLRGTCGNDLIDQSTHPTCIDSNHIFKNGNFILVPGPSHV